MCYYWTETGKPAYATETLSNMPDLTTKTIIVEYYSNWKSSKKELLKII